MGGVEAVPTAREEEMGAVDEFFESWWSLAIAVIWAGALVYMHMTRPQQQQQQHQHQEEQRQHQPAQGKEAMNSSAKAGKVGRRGKRDKWKDS